MSRRSGGAAERERRKYRSRGKTHFALKYTIYLFCFILLLVPAFRFSSFASALLAELLSFAVCLALSRCETSLERISSPLAPAKTRARQTVYRSYEYLFDFRLLGVQLHTKRRRGGDQMLTCDGNNNSGDDDDRAIHVEREARVVHITIRCCLFLSPSF